MSNISIGKLGGRSTYSNSVNSTDSLDSFSFSLTAGGNLSLSLTSLSADANLQLFNSSGTAIRSSSNTGTSAETIEMTGLAAGNYSVSVKQVGTASTSYNLSLTSDYAGNTLSTARNLGDLKGSSDYSDFVGTTDTSDFYRFSLSTLGSLKVGLNGLSADANIQVIRDTNNNGAIDTGELLKTSTNTGTTDETISITNLAAGTYFVKAYSGTNANTNYNLSLSADYAGKTFSSARNLGDLNGSSSYSDFVGTTDTSDRYRFNLTAKGNLNVGLSDLSADANLQVIRDANNNGAIDTGDVIKGSYNSGTTSESISLTNLEAGAYFVQVYPNTGVNTNYNLSLISEYGGNTLSTARNISTLNSNSSYSDFVSTTDTVDFYRFSFSAVAALKVGLNGLSADADIEVIHDTNNNGLIDAGEVLDTSADLGTTEESISLSNLSAGTYFVKAYLGADASTNYNLSLTADYAGKTLETARNLDTLNGNSSYSDFVGTTDSDDFYRFSLTAASDISFKLNGLSDNANLQVIWDANNNRAIDTGEVLITGTNPGTTAESISLTGLNAGIYFIQVYPGTKANTNYSLGLTVVSSTSVVTQLTNNSTNDDGDNFQVVGSNVFWRGYDGSDYEIFRYDGSQITQLTNNSTNDKGYKVQASGSKVVWYSYDGTDYEIYSSDGTTVTQLSNNSTSDYNPQFVGSKVLWQGYDGNDLEIYSYHGTTVTQLTNNGYDDSFQIVGSKAIWSSYDGTDNEIYSSDGTTVTQLTNNSYDDSSLRVYGSIAVWNGFDGTDNEIFRYDDSRVTQLTNNSTDDDVIQVDGSNIFWRSYDGTDYELFRYSRVV